VCLKITFQGLFLDALSLTEVFRIGSKAFSPVDLYLVNIELK